jgi:serine protease inhibitor
MLRAYGASDTTFGLGLLGAVCKTDAGQGNGNIAISPVSVASSLGLALLGARGSTAASMARAMSLPVTSARKLAAGLRVRSQLLSSLDGPGVTFTQSNHIWADNSLATKAAYLKTLRTAYQAELSRVPLMSDPDQAATTINGSVYADTDGHIANLVSPASLGGQLGWVLTNALYLDAAWKHPFDPHNTRDEPFSSGHGHVTASFMNGTDFRFANEAGFTAAALPYQGGRLRMIALMPDGGQHSSSRDAKAQAAGSGCVLPAPGQLRALESKLATTRQTTSVALPKVTLSWSGSLNQPLTSLGMGAAFSRQADFTGISDQACCIGFVQHAATLAVGEKGTVASAATATGIVAEAELAGLLRFNRPFLLVLEDTLTGEPLMLAWVADPASS